MGKKLLIILAFLLVIAGLGALLYLNQSKHDSYADQIEFKPSKSFDGVENLDGYDIITYQGKKYQKNPEIKTILFLGIDNAKEESSTVDISNIGRADTIIVFLVNDKEKTVSFLPISRDSITKVDIYDKKDQFVSSGQEHINMQYSYGNIMEHGSILMTNCVSNFLYRTPISDYMTITMDGLATLVDQLGGITVTFPEDYTEIHPDYQQGVTMTLDGLAAEHFVRHRDSSIVGSNNMRMKRANWIVKELFSLLASNSTKTSLISLIEKENENDAADTYLKTNLSTQNMKRLSSYDLSDTVYEITGEDKVEKGHDAFYADEEKLQDLLINLFYLPLEE